MDNADTKSLIDKTIWIDTMDRYAKPHKYVALPLVQYEGDIVVVLDIYGDKRTITVAKPDRES